MLDQASCYLCISCPSGNFQSSILFLSTPPCSVFIGVDHCCRCVFSLCVRTWELGLHSRSVDRELAIDMVSTSYGSARGCWVSDCQFVVLLGPFTCMRRGQVSFCISYTRGCLCTIERSVKLGPFYAPEFRGFFKFPFSTQSVL